jgi:hypothetical protein
MRTLTMQGVAPDPNWQRRASARFRIAPEPVFQLTGKLPRDSTIPQHSRPPTREVQGFTVGEPREVHASWRPVVVRVAGLLALAAALFGSGFVLRDSAARRQALSWATLGHADVVLRAVH